MERKAALDSLATIVLVACAVAMTGMVVRREFANSRRPSTRPTERRNWAALAVGDMRLGASTAPVTITEFSDFECPYCEMLYQTLERLRARHPTQLSIVYRNYPLATIHRSARPAAIAAQCAAIAGRFPEYYHYVFSHQDSLAFLAWPVIAAKTGIVDTVAFKRCLTSPAVLARLRADSLAATTLQVRGTPTVLINRWQLNEAPTDSVLEYYVQKELVAGGR